MDKIQQGPSRIVVFLCMLPLKLWLAYNFYFLRSIAIYFTCQIGSVCCQLQHMCITYCFFIYFVLFCWSFYPLESALHISATSNFRPARLKILNFYVCCHIIDSPCCTFLQSMAFKTLIFNPRKLYSSDSFVI